MELSRRGFLQLSTAGALAASSKINLIGATVEIAKKAPANLQITGIQKETVRSVVEVIARGKEFSLFHTLNFIKGEDADFLTGTLQAHTEFSGGWLPETGMNSNVLFGNTYIENNSGRLEKTHNEDNFYVSAENNSEELNGKYSTRCILRRYSPGDRPHTNIPKIAIESEIANNLYHSNALIFVSDGKNSFEFRANLYDFNFYDDGSPKMTSYDFYFCDKKDPNIPRIAKIFHSTLHEPSSYEIIYSRVTPYLKKFNEAEELVSKIKLAEKESKSHCLLPSKEFLLARKNLCLIELEIHKTITSTIYDLCAKNGLFTNDQYSFNDRPLRCLNEKLSNGEYSRHLHNFLSIDLQEVIKTLFENSINSTLQVLSDNQQENSQPPPLITHNPEEVISTVQTEVQETTTV